MKSVISFVCAIAITVLGSLAAMPAQAQTRNWQFEYTSHADPNPGNGSSYNPNKDSTYSSYTISDTRPDLLAHSEAYTVNIQAHCYMSFPYRSYFVWYGGGTPSPLQADITLDGNSNQTSSQFSGVNYADAASQILVDIIPQGGSTLHRPKAEYGYGTGDQLLSFPNATVVLGTMGVQQTNREYFIDSVSAASTQISGSVTGNGGGVFATGKTYINYVPKN